MSSINETHVFLGGLTPNLVTKNVSFLETVKKVAQIAQFVFLGLATFLFPSAFCTLPLALSYLSYEVATMASNLKAYIRQIETTSREDLIRNSQELEWVPDLSAPGNRIQLLKQNYVVNGEGAADAIHPGLWVENKYVGSIVTSGAPLSRLLLV